MSMRIQDAFSNCCEGIKDFTSTAATWIGKTVTATGSFVIEGASKVAEYVKPHFEHIKNFAQENKQSIVIAAIAFTVGAVATSVVNHIFSRGTNPTPPETAANPGSAVTATN